MPLFGKSSSKLQPSQSNNPNNSSSSASSVHDPQNPQNPRYQQQIVDPRPYPARTQSHRHSSNLSLDRPVDRPPVNVAAQVNAAVEASPPSQQYQQQPQQQQQSQPQQSLQQLQPQVPQQPPPPQQGDHRHSFLPHHSQEGSQQYRGEREKEHKSKSIRHKLFGSSSSKEPPPVENPNLANQRPVNRRVSLRKSDGQRYSAPLEDQQRLQPPNWNQRQASNTNLTTSTEEDESNLDPFLQQPGGDSPQIPQVPLKDSGYGQQQAFGQDSFRDPYRQTPGRLDTNQGQYPPNQGSPDQHSGSSGNSAQPTQAPFIAYQNEAPQSPVQGQQGYQAFQPPPPPSHGQPPAYSAPHQEGQQYQPLPGQVPPGFQEGQVLRRPSQQIHQGEKSIHQPQPQDPQLLAGPPSGQQFNPPSPAGYQAYDPQTGSQGSTTPNEEQNPMAPPPHNRNNIRSGDMGSQKVPGPSTRESSLQPPPGAPGQVGPISPGVSGFNAGVVPQNAQGQPYRGNGKGEGEPGRETPRPAQDMTEEDWENLRKEHEILREKYQKVKRYFFDQQSQVHQLQNTLANQRMSMSRTSLDDSEYAARFKRLDGLVAQLAHSIRKNWKGIPPWMQGSVNKEAVGIGAKEMIIVGRSVIAHWIHREVFEKYFHPDLEPSLSIQLKTVQLNIKRFSPPIHSTEEEEALWAKIINWRMATLEGLTDVLRSPQATTNRQRLIELLNEKLITFLEMYLQEAASPELHGNVPMIIELAVGIACHLPIESRDVNIDYFEPGFIVNPELMTLESGIAALTNPCSDLDADNAPAASDAPADDAAAAAAAEGKRSKGMFGGLMGSSKPKPGAKIASGIGGGSQVSLSAPPGSSSGPKDEQPQRVRLAAGLSVQIRGRSVLVKAPVYPTFYRSAPE